MFTVISNLYNEIFETKTGIKSYPIKPYFRLDAPVSSHADMLICVLDKTVFCYKEHYLENESVFNEIISCGYKIVFVEKICQKDYPNDIALNVLKVNNTVFCNLKHTAKEILEYAQNNNYKLVNVNQGYASCSTLVLSNKCAITADKGIFSALKAENVDCLLIDENGIRLDGYSYGFIGGSSAVIGNTVYFFGSLDNHPSSNEIKAFLKERMVEFVEIDDNYISDFGGAKTFYI